MFKLLKLGTIATVIAVMGLLTLGTSAFAQGPVTTPPLAGLGLRLGGPANSLVAIAAQNLNLSVTALVAELNQGASIADVAKAKGVATQTLVDAMVANRTALLKTAVDAKRITQAQMDAEVAVLKTNVTTRINTPWTPGTYAMGTGLGTRPGFGTGTGFVDANKDGICDYCGRTGQFLGPRGSWSR